MKTTIKLLAITLLFTVFGCSSDDDASSAPSNVTTTNFSNTIPENSPNGTIAGTVSATAGQGSLNYVISSQAPNGALTINPATGELSVSNSALFDFETNPFITANVDVSDDLSTATSIVTINLSDVKDVIYKHTATVDNSSGNVTYIDHPFLNGNPDAKIVISHNWNGGTYNDNITGVWYSNVEQKWSVFNEDSSTIVDGSTYNIYIALDGEIITHIAAAANQGSSSSYTILDHPLVNGNPDQKFVITTYWNPNSVYNQKNYSTWYDGTNWILFCEDLGAIPNNAAFNILIKSDTVAEFSHQASTTSISGNYTIIDHAALNNNPDALFVFNHNWGVDATSTNVVLDKTLSLWYTGLNWAIYTEDQSAMPENASFDIIVTGN